MRIADLKTATVRWLLSYLYINNAIAPFDWAKKLLSEIIKIFVQVSSDLLKNLLDFDEH